MSDDDDDDTFILKKKQSSKGKSMMSLASKSNHSKVTPFSTTNNSNVPFSLSQLSHYSDMGNHLDGQIKATANGSSGSHHHHNHHHNFHQHLGYHNYLRSSSSLKPLNNITLPNSTNLINTTGTNSLHYTTFPTPALQSMFSRLNDPLGLPNLLNHYSSNNHNPGLNKLVGPTSVINSAKKYS